MQQETKNCHNCKKDFIIEPEDFNFYEKMRVPAPTFCWLCRAQRRMAFRNERSLFKRKSDSTGKDIFSAFAPDAPVKVYEKEVWLTDQWDPMEYGHDYNFSRPFFEQFKELLSIVPLKNLNLVNAVKSDYCNNFTDPKNCYLAFNGKGAEDCMYGNGFTNSKNCVDTSNVARSERCYESFWLTQCTNTIFSSQCESSYNLSFCRNCNGCHDCFGSVNQRNKSYCIFNEQYTKEEYEKKVAEFNIDSYVNLEKMRIETIAFWNKFPTRFMIGLKNTNVSGNYIENSKDIKNSFLVRESQNIHYSQYVQELPGSKDVWDYTAWGDSNELVYECAACGIGTHNIKFCYNVQESVRDIEYSYMCSGSSNLFGCIGLRKKQYCIFNKQYTREEYEELVSKIKEHMDDMPYTDKKGRVYKYGEFFPVELSPFAYNETLAQDYFPLTPEVIKEKGYFWRSPAEKNYKPTIMANDLPDSIKNVDDSIVKEIIGCEHEGKCNDQCTVAFRVIPEEIQFYKAMNLPLPRLCPSCRYQQRIAQRTSLNVYNRKCAKCGKNIETNYSPDRPEIIYCESCYQQEVS